MSKLEKQISSPIEDQTFTFDNNIVHTPSDRVLNQYNLSYSAPEDQYTEQINYSVTSPEDVYLRHNRFAGTVADKNLSRIENAEDSDRINIINQILKDAEKNIVLDSKTDAYLYNDGSVLYTRDGEITDGTRSLENKAERIFRESGRKIGPDFTTYEQQNDPDTIFDESQTRIIEQRRRPETERSDASRFRGRLLRSFNNYIDNPYPESQERKLIDRVLETIYFQANKSAMIGKSEVHELKDGSILQIDNLEEILNTIEQEETFRRKTYDPQYVEEYDPDLEDVINLSAIKVLRSQRDINRAKEALEKTSNITFGLSQGISRLRKPERPSVVRTFKAPERAISYEGVDLDEITETQESELERFSDIGTRREDDYIRDNREDIIERILSGESYDSIAEAYDVNADSIETFYTGRDKEGNVFVGAFRPRDIALAKRRRRDKIDEQNTLPEDQIFSESRKNESEIKWKESNNQNYIRGYDDDGYEYSIKPSYIDRDKYSVSIIRLDNLIMDSSRQGEVFNTIEESMDWADRQLSKRVDKDINAAFKRGEYGLKGVKPSKDNIDLAVAIAYHKYVGSSPDVRNNPYEDTDLTPSMMARDMLEDPRSVYDDSDDEIITSSDILRTPVENKEEVIDFIEKTAMDLAIEDYLEEKETKSDTSPEDQYFLEDRKLREISDRIEQNKYTRPEDLRAFNERSVERAREARRRYLERKESFDDPDTDPTVDDIETYLRKREEFGTSPEDQYLMVNVHGAYDRDAESRRNIKNSEDISLFDSNLSTESKQNKYENKINKYFNNKKYNQKNILHSQSQVEKLNSKKPQLSEYHNNELFNNKINDKVNGKIPFGSYNKQFNKQENIQLYDDILIMNNSKQQDKENYIIKNGVMAQARNLVQE